MLTRMFVVTMATAVNAGNGATAPRWSGTQSTSKPASSARLAVSCSTARDLMNRMLSPKRKSLATNNLHSTELRNLPRARRGRQSLDQASGGGRQTVQAGKWTARAQTPDPHRQFELSAAIADPVDGVVRMQAA